MSKDSGLPSSLMQLRCCYVDPKVVYRHYLDLCAAVPYFTMNDTMRELIWDDGLHLTVDGYEMMGEAIATQLLELLNVVEKPLNIGKRNI